MKLKGNTIFITGGSNGIGYALAERFLAYTFLLNVYSHTYGTERQLHYKRKLGLRLYSTVGNCRLQRR